jgi:hypothetical protein
MRPFNFLALLALAPILAVIAAPVGYGTFCFRRRPENPKLTVSNRSSASDLAAREANPAGFQAYVCLFLNGEKKAYQKCADAIPNMTAGRRKFRRGARVAMDARES